MKTRRKIRGSCFADDSVAQWIERLPPEQKVASSSLVGITDRRIEFLLYQKNVKKYGYLFDKICTYENLYRAYLNARSKKGIKGGGINNENVSEYKKCG